MSCKIIQVQISTCIQMLSWWMVDVGVYHTCLCHNMQASKQSACFFPAKYFDSSINGAFFIDQHATLYLLFLPLNNALISLISCDILQLIRIENKYLNKNYFLCNSQSRIYRQKYTSNLLTGGNYCHIVQITPQYKQV